MSRSYKFEGEEIKPGCGVVQGASSENHVSLPDENGDGDFLGVYGFYEKKQPKTATEHIDIIQTGEGRVITGGTVTAGKWAVLAGDKTGYFIECPMTAGETFKICGQFLESGPAGCYVTMLVNHFVLTVPGA